MDLMELPFSTYSCATLRFVTDAERDKTVPAGVVLWNNDGSWHQFRLPEEDEQVPGLPTKACSYLELVQSQIEGWIESRSLPYEPHGLKLLSHAWWEHVQKLLQFSVRIDAISLLNVSDPEEEAETLFEAIVQPHVSRKKKAERIDRAVTGALGTLSRFFTSRAKVPGFGGRKVKVLRHAANQQRMVIVEAVNLASRDAESDADALFGRLSRVRAVQSQQDVRFVLGYLASANGLNGEKALKEFIETEIEAPMFDLDRQKDEFQEAALRESEAIDPALALFSASHYASRVS